MHLHEIYAILTQQGHSHLEILINYILCDKYFKMFMIFNSNRQWSCFTEIRVAQDQLPQHLLSLSQNDAVATFLFLPSSTPPHLPYSLLPEKRVPTQGWLPTVLFPMTNISSVPVCARASILVFLLPRMRSVCHLHSWTATCLAQANKNVKSWFSLHDPFSSALSYFSACVSSPP